MEEQKAVSTVSVEFKKSSSYNIVPATGAWATRTVDGNIICNFLVESQEAPKTLTLGLSSAGEVISEERSFKGDEPGYIKELMVGVFMTPDMARGIGEWLVNVVDENALNTTFMHSEQVEGLNGEEPDDKHDGV